MYKRQTIDGVLLGEFIKAGSITAEKLSAEYKASVTNEINTTVTSKFQVAENLISAEVTRATGQEVELAAAIQVTSEQINQKVSKGDVSSQLSLEAGQITLSGPRLKIDTENFKLDTLGNIEANNAILSDATMRNVTIIGGNIEIESTLATGRKMQLLDAGIVFIGNDGRRGIIDANQGGNLRIIGKISTGDDPGSNTATLTTTGTIPYVRSIEIGSDGSITTAQGSLRFINGMLVSNPG